MTVALSPKGQAVDLALEYHLDNSAEECKELIILNNKSCIKQAHNEVKSLFNTSFTESRTKSQSLSNQSSANSAHGDNMQYLNMNRKDDFINENRYRNYDNYSNDNLYRNNEYDTRNIRLNDYEENNKFYENNKKENSGENGELSYENNKRSELDSSRRNSKDDFHGFVPLKNNYEDENERFQNKSPGSLSQNMKHNTNNDNRNNNESIDRSRRNSNQTSNRNSISNPNFTEIDNNDFIYNRDPLSTVRTGEANPYSKRLSATEILLNSEFPPNSKISFSSTLHFVFQLRSMETHSFSTSIHCFAWSSRRNSKSKFILSRSWTLCCRESMICLQSCN